MPQSENPRCGQIVNAHNFILPLFAVTITITITITEQNNSPYAGWFGKPQGDVLF
jgi:hypothetical protein